MLPEQPPKVQHAPFAIYCHVFTRHDNSLVMTQTNTMLLPPPQKVEVQGDPDVEHGGSRPVGQVARGLDRIGELLR